MTKPVNGITHMDHPVYAVASLDEARITWEKLGFTVPPRGSHIEWGTGNLCIMFQDDYLEMRGIIDPDRFLMHLEEHLALFGEGLMGTAFATDDVHSSYHELIEKGVDVAKPRHLTRNFELPEGWTKPSFELCVPAADAIEGLMHIVVIQHLTPELTRQPDFLVHANSATGVASLSGVIFDVQSVATKMRRLFGDSAIQQDQSSVEITLPSRQRISLLLEDTFAAKFGARPATTGKPTLGAIDVRVADLAATAETLQTNGVPYQPIADDKLRIGETYASGSILEFSEQPADQ